MKTLSEYFKSMYVWASLLLLLCAAASSYAMKTFPANLFIAIAACALFDLTIKKLFLRRGLGFPASAVITGTIIGSIAPLNALFVVVLVASAIAIASKYIIRIKQRHVFNPATLGLLIALFAFRLGDVWWAAAGINVLGFAIPLTLILIIAAYKADKIKASITFLLITALLYAVTGFVSVPFTASGLLSFAASMPYYFTFIMLVEPKTSPYMAKEQVVFGAAVALLTFALDYNSFRFPFFIALLAGNLVYSLHRSGLLRLTALTIKTVKKEQ